MRKNAKETLESLVNTCENQGIYNFTAFKDIIKKKNPSILKDGIEPSSLAQIDNHNEWLIFSLKSIKYCIKQGLLEYLPDRFILRDNSSRFVLNLNPSDIPGAIKEVELEKLSTFVNLAISKYDTDSVDKANNQNPPVRESVERIANEILYLLENSSDQNKEVFYSKYINSGIHFFELYFYFGA